jgi:antagonist of KipI
VLGSRSTHSGSRLGGLDGGPLKAGDTLPLGEPSPSAAPGRRLPNALRPEYGRELTVRVIPGPQDAAFTAEGIETFYSSPYTVTEKSDRQGVRLDGPKIEAKNGRYDIVSDAVVFGSVQVPGDGMPIVLLADRQTTGGYAKIGIVATVDLPKLAQAAPGTVIRFVQTSVQDAQKALRDRRQALLSAGLLSGLAEREFPLSIGGSGGLKLAYRPKSLATPGGTLVAVRSGAGLLTVRAEDVTNR